MMLFLIQNQLAARIKVALGKQKLTDDHYITVHRESNPYYHDLIQFYRVTKRKHVVSNEQALDWSNTGLLNYWLENEDPTLVPDHYYHMAEVNPSISKGLKS